MSEDTPISPLGRANTFPAMILFGPTGSGKTPLGRLIESRGLHGAAWRHLDFGEELRRAAGGSDSISAFDPKEREALRRILEEHRLLHDDELWIAERILRDFITKGWALPGGARGGIVLNGLPRNVQQAELVGRYCEPRLIVELSADAATIRERLRTNRGGDRGGRADDAPDAVISKLEWYRRETEPLIELYRGMGCTAIQIPISPDTAPEETYAALNRMAL